MDHVAGNRELEFYCLNVRLGQSRTKCISLQNRVGLFSEGVPEISLMEPNPSGSLSFSTHVLKGMYPSMEV